MQKGVSTHSNTAPASHPRSPSKPWAHQPTEGVMWGFLVTVPQKPGECLLLGRRTLGHAMPVPLGQPGPAQEVSGQGVPNPHPPAAGLSLHAASWVCMQLSSIKIQA